MKKNITILAILWGVTGAVVAQEYPYTDPDNAGGWQLLETVSDEFDGTDVDRDKWYVQGESGHFENNFVGRAPSQFAPGNVEVKDGFLTIYSRWEPDYDYSDKIMNGYAYENITTAAIITKSQFHYGYMEIRCKAADGPMSSAFWTTGQGGELDVFEHYGNNPNNPYSAKRYHTSFHDWRDPQSPTWGKRIWTNEHILNFRVADDFHIYGLEWDADYIKIYVDGQLIKCSTREEIDDAWVVNNPQKVWLDSEAFPWEVNPDQLSAEDFPGEGRQYFVDYVRIWQKENVISGCEDRDNLIANGSLESGLTGWDTQGAVTVAMDQAHEGAQAMRLSGLGAAEQTITVKPHTTYLLSAWVRMPSTNMSNVWHNAYLGAKDYGDGQNDVRYFRPDYTYQSLQFTTGSTTQATIYFENRNASHQAYADDFELVELEDLSGNTPVLATPKVMDTLVYPNPVRDQLTVFTERKSVVSVHNSAGIEIFSTQWDEGERALNTSDWLPGIYYLRLSPLDGSHQQVYRMVKK
ncbi:family 16 glycosylhydrolase [Reichenbachiella agariperforans]|uniref:family 16 glycosylhydrolase n=1 Tax=Reichenbachiella agariperforans TaxID=156994 RepID=UPI001C097807|nr:family 16 glycosylhydrolase [Reichenbachiella agariperforans]MBU2912764.1 family 16 glycosylhydrolase [Reichenbachiella agariperforans]